MALLTFKKIYKMNVLCIIVLHSDQKFKPNYKRLYLRWGNLDNLNTLYIPILVSYQNVRAELRNGLLMLGKGFYREHPVYSSATEPSEC
jgi:hypothetical protein